MNPQETSTCEVNSPSDFNLETYTMHRRFDRMGRLVGDQVMAKLMSSHVMVIGLGGVGSWAAESLIRSGVGKITVVDFDSICITNTNRQLHSMHGMVGRKKAKVLEERFQKINPKATVKGIELFYEAETSDEILSENPDIILDAIDNVTAKCHLLATCRAKGISVISSGGSGARMDPTQIRTADLSETHSDPLLNTVRRVLRVNYNFPREGLMGIPTVFSAEPTSEPFELTYDGGKGFRCVCPNGKNDHHSCEKRRVIYGTASFVTGTFGFTMASLVVKKIQQEANLKN